MKNAIGGLFVALLLAGSAWPQGGVITSFAGGAWVFTGNGKPAVNAPLGNINGVTLDPAGNVVFADYNNNIVARVNADGTLSVIAGNGVNTGLHSLHTGDGGPAVNAALYGPQAAAYDSQGNLYIEELDRISRVSPQGIISTYAGGGTDSTSNGIPALQAALLPYAPCGGLVIDAAGVVYFTELFFNRVRKVTPDGTVSTVAGTGTSGFSGDGGPATAATLSYPTGLALDSSGNLYIADNGNGAVRKVTPTGMISTILTNSNACGLHFDSGGVLYIAGYGLVYKLPPGSLNPILVGGVLSSGIFGFGSTGFSGDGGPALAAQFAILMSIVPDNLGNLFIGDSENDRVRRISANGTVTTVAGNGQYYYAGEGVPAATSPVSAGALAIDKSGDIYYTGDNNRVRKIAGGIINTVAGNGVAGFSGDGGPATKASLNAPSGLALDGSGNLYIADFLNFLVRRVAPDGTISTYAQMPFSIGAGLATDAAGNLYVSDGFATVYRIDTAGNQTVFAGTGSPGYSGDYGPANLAMLNEPQGLAMDTFGNLYIGDTLNGRVRVVSPRGVISTFVSIPPGPFPALSSFSLAFDGAGNLYVSDGWSLVYKVAPAGVVSIFAGGGQNYPGNGGLATQASLVSPYGVVADASGDVYIADSVGIQVVSATPPTISLQQTSLSVSAASGGAPVTQTVTVVGSVPGLAFTVSVSASDGGNWLSAGAASGQTPDLLSITADPSNLPPGKYTGTVTIVPVAAVPAGGTPANLILNVTFIVGAALAPQLSVDQPNLSFTYPAGSTARSATLKISNAGGGALAFTVSTNTSTGGSWLSFSPASGSVSPGAPVVLTVTADPSNLKTGTYTGSVTIQSAGGGTVVVAVNLAISSLSQALLLTQTGMSFTAVAQGGVVPPQTFGVVNLGTGSLGWTASASTLSGGNWLSVTPGSGSSNGSLAAPQVTVIVNQSGLAAGDYYGLVTITGPGAANTPQVVTVSLTVLPAGSDPGASVQPAELFFTTTAGGDSPGSQEVLVYSVGAAAQVFYTDSSLAFVVDLLPGSATLDPSQPTRVLVQPITSNLAAGTYNDSLNFQFSDGRVRTVKVNVVAAASGLGGTGDLRPRDGSACVPTKLIPALTTLGQSFAVTAGWPVALAVQSVDDCGNPQTAGSVTVLFSNGDPPLALGSLNDGTWQGTWATAQSGSGQPVTLTITAANIQPQLTGTAVVQGGVSSPKTPPTITQAGIVSAASPVSFTALAPGGMIAIYGNLLADNIASAPADQFPLPTTLGNATVIIGGRAAPLLYASQGQINALVPFGLNTNTPYQLLIQRDLTLSTPVPVNIADAQPGVFVSGGSAVAVDYRGAAPAFLVTQSAPAQAGDVLVVYCAGLGVTNPTVADGAASPASPPAQPVAQVTASIGGVNANVQYAGLVAGLVGLYQVNVAVPAGVTPGNAVPVMLTVAGQTSPAANIATQ